MRMISNYGVIPLVELEVLLSPPTTTLPVPLAVLPLPPQQATVLSLFTPQV